MKKILIVFVLMATTVHAGWFGPSSYNECILENMKGVTTERGASLVATACRSEFPATKKQNIFPAGTLKPDPVRFDLQTVIYDDEIREGVNEMNKTLPMMISSEIQLTRVSLRGYSEIAYIMKTIIHSKNQVAPVDSSSNCTTLEVLKR